MGFDDKLTTGVVIGLILGLYYHASLVAYLPLLVIVGVIMLLKTLPYAGRK